MGFNEITAIRCTQFLFEAVKTLSQPTQLFDDIVTHMAFGTQLNQIAFQKKFLNSLNKENDFAPEDALRLSIKRKFIEAKEKSLNAYIEMLSLRDKAHLALWETVKKFAFIPRLITQLPIHPAAYFHQYESLTSPSWFLGLRNIQELIKKAINKVETETFYRAKQFQIYTSDHQQLDACLIPTKDKDRPTMVMVSGNFACYEVIFPIAKQLAETLNINILLYNSRGINQSLGTERNTGDAVEDCKAVIKYALSNLCKNGEEIDPKKLAVWGESLGGGITAEALRQLIQEGVIKEGELGLYLNHHSFGSLYHFIYGATRIIIPIIGWLFLKCLGINNMLDAYQAISQYKLAKDVIITTATNDEVIQGKARLEDCVKDLKDRNITCFTNRRGHNELDDYIPRNDKKFDDLYKSYGEILSNWSKGE